MFVAFRDDYTIDDFQSREIFFISLILKQNKKIWTFRSIFWQPQYRRATGLEIEIEINEATLTLIPNFKAQQISTGRTFTIMIETRMQ